MNPFTRLFSWLASLVDGGYVNVPPIYTGTRRRYARGTCERCGKMLAMTHDGRLWKHACVRKEGADDRPAA